MPNHVHVLIETKQGYDLSGIAHSWKSFTANKANAILERKGNFWMQEYYDRYIIDTLSRAFSPQKYF
jgi:REP element-mobilizing transposase RayT